jgi:hypothetical protein
MFGLVRVIGDRFHVQSGMLRRIINGDVYIVSAGVLGLAADASSTDEVLKCLLGMLADRLSKV